MFRRTSQRCADGAFCRKIVLVAPFLTMATEPRCGLHPLWHGVSMDRVPPFDARHLTSIAKILTDSEPGLTEAQLVALLRDSKIPDCSPEMSSWKRLFSAFIELQNQRHFGNHVVVFINRAMGLTRSTWQARAFTQQREQLNAVLALSGTSVGDDGKVHWDAPAPSSQVDPSARAERLRAALLARGAHPKVLEGCQPELFRKHYFAVVFEAVTVIAARIRKMSGVIADGSELAMQSFAWRGNSKPIVCINALSTDAEKAEQRSFLQLASGLLGTVSSARVAAAKLEWAISEQDALDMLSVASLVHRKLDRARGS